MEQQELDPGVGLGEDELLGALQDIAAAAIELEQQEQREEEDVNNGNGLNDGEEEDGENSDDENDEKDEPPDMILTSAERDWALRIKETIASAPAVSPRIKVVSDLMIAQMALVSAHDGEMGDVTRIKEQIHNYHDVLEAFALEDTLAQGKEILRRFVQDVLPGFLLNFYFQSDEGNYVLILDLHEFNMEIFSDNDKILLWLQACFYLNHCQSPDLAAIRAGVTYLIECQGYDWKLKYAAQVQTYKEWANLVYGYPLHFKAIIHFHTGVFVNLMTSLGKRFLPPRIARKFMFGYVSEQGRLDQLYLRPSLEAANQRLIHRLEQALELRYENEAKFTL